jgi:hypothetical protein
MSDLSQGDRAAQGYRPKKGRKKAAGGSDFGIIPDTSRTGVIPGQASFSGLRPAITKPQNIKLVMNRSGVRFPAPALRNGLPIYPLCLVGP